MKCVIPEIAYHNRDPVLSVDFQITKGEPVRLATAGSDTHVVIWSVTQSDEGAVELDCLCDLTRHQRAVNIVRWSPDGSLLASGDDESVIIVWQLKPGQGDGGLFDEGSENKENWVVYKMLRFHLDDVYDLSWSPCGQFLLSGSVDNSAVISNVHKNSKVAHFSDSRGFVQGVSWNKKHNILSTLGSDRACRSYNTNSKKIISKTYKSVLNLKDETVVKKKKDVKPSDVQDSTKTSEPKPVNKEVEKKEETKEPTKEKEVRLFHDETFKGFFRRLSWSNDGEILVVPSGVIETDGDTKMTHCSWVFSRVDLVKPALCLPTKDKYTIAVRFSPKLYALRPIKQSPPPPESSSLIPPWTAANSLFALPYRMVYAVATQNAIMFYDTQQAAPFGRVSNVHYTGLTDLTWSPCGTIVFASSSDGYCSIITFSSGELGVEYTPPTPAVTKEDSTPNKLPTPFTSKPAPTTTTTTSLPTTTTSLPTSGLNSEGVLSPAQVHIKSTKEGGKSNPKRLQFITLSSPKAEKKMSKLQIKDIESDKIDTGDNLGVERMETEADDLCLVLEETQPEAPIQAAPPPCDQTAKPVKKRVPLTTIATGPNHPPGGQAATPEKAKGRRVNLITLSSPKPKS